MCRPGQHHADLLPAVALLGVGAIESAGATPFRGGHGPLALGFPPSPLFLCLLRC